MNTTCESVLHVCLICVLYSQQYGHVITQRSSHGCALRSSFLDGTVQYYLCLNSVSTLPLSLPFFKLRLLAGRFSRRSKCAGRAPPG